METNAQYFDCLCRTCMNKVEASSHDGNPKPQQQLLSIFDQVEECGQLRIAELLSDAVPQIEVQASDELPKKICPECQQRLLSVYRFQQMCVQSDKQMHELLSKEQTVLETPMLEEAIKGETEGNDADSEPLKDLPCISTLQNLQQPSIQESLAEVTVQTNKSEAAQSSAADHLQDDIKLIEHCNDSKVEFEEFIKNEPMEDDEANSEYSDVDTIHSIISVTKDEFEEFIKNEPIDDDEEANSKYSDVDTMHSTISVTNDEPKELEDQQVNVTSCRHNCHLCNKSYKRREYLRRHLNNHKKKATNRKEYCYACSLCGESYKEQRFLSRHLNLEHPNSKSNASSDKTVHERPAKPHECDICGKKFRQNAGLTIHKRIHSTEKPHKCDLCEKQFVQFHDLKMHIRKHTGEKPYKCKYCECAFTTGSARMKHLRCHLGDNIYRCTFCPLNFPSESEKRLHLTTHQNEDPETRERNLKALEEEEAKLVLKCSKEKGEGQSTEEQQQQKLSNKEIKQPTTERDEFRESTNVSIEDDKSNTEYSDGNTIHSTISATKDETSPIEPEDQQVNATRDEFGVFVINEPIEDNNPSTEYSDGDTMHSIISVMKDEPTESEYEQVNDAHNKVTNKKEYRHICHLCGESYLKEGYLARHLSQEHSIESKGNTCEFCNKSFKTTAYLRDHIRIHTGERPYSCSDCGKSFNQHGSLAKHRKIHTRDKPHECTYCQKRFSLTSLLKRHSVIHKEAKGHECDTCAKRFAIESDLAKHKRYHTEEKPHYCDSCGKQFYSNHLLQIHIRTHTGEKPYKCKYCERGFISTTLMNQHLRSHLGKNIYRCELCPLAFPLHSEMRLHLTTHENEDPETREQNLKALQEEEAKFKLKYSENKIEK